MNAKSEFLAHTSGKEILCCNIFTEENSEGFILTTGWTQQEMELFLSNLEFEYDNGYGGQFLYGIIWYKDGTWSDRGEYDGSEWYEYHIVPEIPPNLKRIDKVREEKLSKVLDDIPRKTIIK